MIIDLHLIIGGLFHIFQKEKLHDFYYFRGIKMKNEIKKFKAANL